MARCARDPHAGTGTTGSPAQTGHARKSDGTQLCHAESGDVLEAIIDPNADVISLAAVRSGMAVGAAA